MLIKNISDTVAVVTLPDGVVTLLPGKSEPLVNLFYLDRIKEAVSVFKGMVILVESDDENITLLIDTEDSKIIEAVLEDNYLNNTSEVIPLESVPSPHLIVDEKSGNLVLDSESIARDKDLKEEKRIKAVTNIFNSEKIDKAQKRDILKKIATYLELEFNNNIPTDKLYSLIVT
jgi:hypothetical protein